jgi:hypothetical protein
VGAFLLMRTVRNDLNTLVVTNSAKSDTLFYLTITEGNNNVKLCTPQTFRLLLCG